MTQSDQLSYLKSVKGKLRDANIKVDEYLDYLLEVKRFIDMREDRYDELRDIEILADKLLLVINNFEDPKEEE